MFVDEDFTIFINGQEYSPSQASRIVPNFDLSIIGDTFIVNYEKKPLKMSWNKYGKIELQAHYSNRGKVRGLCGNYNGDVNDERLDRQGHKLISSSQFVNSWKEAGSILCRQESPHNVGKVNSVCKVIKFAPFDQCHSVVPRDNFMTTCSVMAENCLKKNNNDERKCR